MWSFMSKVLAVLHVVNVRSEDCLGNCFCGFDSYQGVRSCLNLSQRHFNDLKYLQIPELDFRTGDNIELYPNDFVQYSEKSLYLHLSDDDVEELSAEKVGPNTTTNIFYLSGKNLIRISENVSSHCTDILIIDKNIFDNLKNLTKLDLSHNNISNIDYRIFSELSDLEEFNRLHRTLLLLFYKTYNNEYYEYAYKGHHSCYRNLSTTSHLTVNMYNNINNYTVVNITTNMTLIECSEKEEIVLRPVSEFYCPNNCVCKTNIDRFGDHISVSLGTYSQVKCNDPSLKKFPGWLSPNTTHLAISHTNISNVDSNYFKNLTNLSNVSFYRNNLQLLPYNVFQPLIHLKILDLSGNKLKTLDSRQFHYLHELENLKLDDNILDSLNEDALKGLSDLVLLNISGNHIESLQCNVLTDQHKLYTLDLSKNNFMIILPCIFKNNSKLSYLNLSNNRYKEMNCETFSKFSYLLELYIASNQINQISPCVFKDLSSLTKLDISKNLLTSLSHSVFRPLKKLLFLDLNGNLITFIHNETFSELKKMAYLDLSNNHLSELGPELFSSNIRLSVIKLRGNFLAFLDSHLLKNSEGVFEFDISSNKLLNITSTFFYRRKLLFIGGEEHDIILFKYFKPSHSLNLSHNMINTIPCNLLEGNSNLREMYLNNNNITSLCDDMLQPSKRFLAIIDLSFNKLDSVPPKLFQNLTSLISLNISHNNLTSLSLGLFDNFKYFLNLDLSYNKIKSLPLGLFKKLFSLLTLNLSSNLLYHLPLGLFSDMTKLNSIDLSANPILYFPATIFNNLTSLISINLANTSVSNRDLIMFNDLYSLHNGGYKLQLEVSRALSASSSPSQVSIFSGQPLSEECEKWFPSLETPFTSPHYASL
uniref:Uncharacterized protein n=1 Tax=Timema shepardi TaxID=629360 RepID=A0A7R9AKH3_TIMSH|nr:unnamed protein product [Timema shepardi]